MQRDEFITGVLKPVEIYKEAWEIIKDQYWMVFAVTIVGMLIGGAIPIILIGPMICGIYICLFAKMEGREVTFEQLFKGFDYFMPSLGVAVVVMVPVFVLLISIYVPMVVMMVAGPRMSESELVPFLVGVIAFEVVVGIIMACFHTLLMFAFPLIADRKLGAIAAMKLSARAVWANLSGVVGLFAVGILVGIVGYLMLCIGIYLVLPLIIMSNAVAYRKIFPPLEPLQISTPPPPTAYSGI